MDWVTLFEMQDQLDKRIQAEHGLNGNQFDDRLLALLVELGELANETRCFKFWSRKGPAPQETILEEYVDGVHFLLSLGLALNLERSSFDEGDAYLTATDGFLDVYNKTNVFAISRTEQSYETLMGAFLALGATLGFTQEMIFEAYVSKNEANHVRQDSGY
ncbi:dUTP diphosphatase [Exiguobacterium flavidum]|uniref:dUTP diphosphatase n=1 Tax=Exiguobacterium flavidum TaxID=2184695 RepID=UPI000DF82C29|nr:dUTP diphosphatase [Exiguobacterium flavidum]